MIWSSSFEKIFNGSNCVQKCGTSYKKRRHSDDDTPLDSLFTSTTRTENTTIEPANTRWQKLNDSFYVIKAEKIKLTDLTEANRNLIKGIILQKNCAKFKFYGGAIFKDLFKIWNPFL